MDHSIRELETAYRDSGSDEAGEAWAQAEARASGIDSLTLVRHLIRHELALHVIVINTLGTGPHLKPQYGTDLAEVLATEVSFDQVVHYLRFGRVLLLNDTGEIE